MTWLWTLLIVIGIAMIVVAVWPGARGGKDKSEAEPREEQKHEGR